MDEKNKNVTFWEECLFGDPYHSHICALNIKRRPETVCIISAKRVETGPCPDVTLYMTHCLIVPVGVVLTSLTGRFTSWNLIDR